MGVLRRSGHSHRLEEEEHRWGVTLLAHFGYGAAVGSLFAPVVEKTGIGGVGSGLLFGLTVWLVSYLGILPALGLFPPPHRETPHRNLLMIAAHLVWGAALGALLAAEDQRE